MSWLDITSDDFTMTISTKDGPLLIQNFTGLYYIWKYGGYGYPDDVSCVIAVDIPERRDEEGVVIPRIKYKLVMVQDE